MEKLVKGDVVVIPFPFSDLSSTKKRPALIIASFREDYILCQITSQASEYSISLNEKDFDKGKLNIKSYIKINRIFTAHKSLIERRVGSLKKEKIKEVVEKLCELIKK